MKLRRLFQGERFFHWRRNVNNSSNSITVHMKLPSIAFLGSAVLSYEVPDVDLASAFAKFKEEWVHFYNGRWWGRFLLVSYGIEYSSPQEAALREEIFIENYRHIQRINSEG